MRLRSNCCARISWPVALTLVALIIATVVVIIFWRIETWPSRTAQQSSAELERLGRDLRAAFVDIAFVVLLALRVGLRDWPGMAPLRELPLSLLPSFVVPLVISSHLLVFIRLLRQSHTG